MTATVGGLWDSLLAEGKPWWISANSDSHQVYRDTLKPGTGKATGSYGPPVDTGAPILTYGDFFPGYYSNTVVGATDRSYAAVMANIRAGRMLCTAAWVSMQVTGGGVAPAMLGETIMPNRGNDVELRVDIAVPQRPITTATSRSWRRSTSSSGGSPGLRRTPVPSPLPTRRSSSPSRCPPPPQRHVLDQLQARQAGRPLLRAAARQ
jgi:hypothetical protein